MSTLAHCGFVPYSTLEPSLTGFSMFHLPRVWFSLETSGSSWPGSRSCESHLSLDASVSWSVFSLLKFQEAVGYELKLFGSEG